MTIDIEQNGFEETSRVHPIALANSGQRTYLEMNMRILITGM
jgi:hypothetical protein